MGVAATKKTNRVWFVFFVWMQQLPIFPCRLQQSIFGASELNFCVRDENRWDLTANVTAMVYTSGYPETYLVYVLYTFCSPPSIFLHGRLTTA